MRTHVRDLVTVGASVQKKTVTSRSRQTAVAMILVSSIGLTACSGDNETPPPTTPTVTADATVDPNKTAVPEPVLPTTWPLTGVEAEVADRPAVAVKIENTAAARPQSGLEAADVVWETIVEFEVSRFIAIFHSQTPDEIGPVRSARPMDIAIVEPLDGLFAFSGAQRRMITRLGRSDAIHLVSNDAGQGGMYRVGNRAAPHNVYASAESFLKEAPEGATVPAEQFAFAGSVDQATAVTAGKDTTSVSLQMSAAARPSWTWSADHDAWLRFENGAKHSSAAGKQLKATNVVIIEAKQIDSGMDAQGGAMVPDYDIAGERGTALVATGGKTIEARWAKGGSAKPMRLETVDGEPLTLAPGNTWVELVPEQSGSYSLD
jgi:hypothetical protein